MLTIRRLIFDEQNLEHIARHHVNQQEVEDVCYSKSLFRRTRQSRMAAYGQTISGRYVIVFLAPRGRGTFYVITARDMARAERRRYESWKGK